MLRIILNSNKMGVQSKTKKSVTLWKDPHFNVTLLTLSIYQQNFKNTKQQSKQLYWVKKFHAQFQTKLRDSHNFYGWMTVILYKALQIHL